MSLAAAGFWVTTLWLVVYAIKYTSRRPRSILPVSQYRRPTVEVTVRQLSLRLKTETLNVFHDRLSVSLSSSNSQVLRKILWRLYDLGSFVGVVGMLLGFCLLFFTLTSLSSEILRTGQSHGLNTVTKRALGYASDDTPPASNLPKISPIIPGLTVPLSHSPMILVALVISQVVHEFGHAITAALHRVPMISCGVAVTFILPSAFVTLPAARLEKLSPRDRLQILSGGCFHNFVLLCLLFFTAWSGAGTLPTWILFRNISTQGRIVVSVDYDSPLATPLPVGTLITKIDDFSMTSGLSDDPWDYYLLSHPSGPLQGWCASNSLLDEAFVAACTSFNGSHSCFVSVVDETVHYELDPVRIFTDNLTRCNHTDCPSFFSCVVPHRDEQLVRISVLRSRAGISTEDVIVWKGPKEEIWEQVRVGHLRPRFPLVPFWLPEVASAFFEYMKISNLSLYVVNMLPIVALDGYQALVALLQLFHSRVSRDANNIDLEAPSNTARSSREGRLQRACQTFLSILAVFLIVLCGLLGVINWARK